MSEALTKGPVRMPVSYEMAKTALSQCYKLDEAKEWENKAAAIKVYAEQAHDETLRKLAVRIQGQAVRRYGELLKKLKPGKPGRKSGGTVPRNSETEPTKSGGVAPHNSERGEAAAKAGLSRDQVKTALRVANVPEEKFEEQISSEDPPSVTKLAEQGTKSKPIDLEGIAPEDFARATVIGGTLERMASVAKTTTPDIFISGRSKAGWLCAKSAIRIDKLKEEPFRDLLLSMARSVNMDAPARAEVGS